MKSKLGIQRLTLIVVALFVIAGVLIIALDWDQMRQIVGQTEWILLLPGLLLAAFSYLCASGSSAVVYRMFRIKLKYTYLLAVGFVGTTATNLFNVGGASGVPLEFLLLKKCTECYQHRVDHE